MTTRPDTTPLTGKSLPLLPATFGPWFLGSGRLATVVFNGDRFIGKITSKQLPHDKEFEVKVHDKVVLGVNKISSIRRIYKSLVEGWENLRVFPRNENLFLMPPLEAGCLDDQVPGIGREFLDAFNKLEGVSAAKRLTWQHHAVRYLESARRLAGLDSDPWIKPNFTSAREQLFLLAELDDDVISMQALTRLSQLLSNLPTELENIRSFQILINRLPELMKKGATPLHKAKILEVTALLLSQYHSLYSQELIVGMSHGLRDEIWSEIDHAVLQNTAENPELAAWIAVARERLKPIRTDTHWADLAQKLEGAAKETALAVASALDAKVNEAGSRAKSVGFSLVSAAYGARKLAPQRHWFKILKQIQEIAYGPLERRKTIQDLTPIALKEIQILAEEALDKDPSHSFTFFMVDILLDAAINATSDEVKMLAAGCRGSSDLPSLWNFIERMDASLTQQVVMTPWDRIKKKVPHKKSTSDIWAHSRLHNELHKALKRLSIEGSRTSAHPIATTAQGKLAWFKRRHQFMGLDFFESAEKSYELSKKLEDAYQELRTGANEGALRIARGESPEQTRISRSHLMQELHSAFGEESFKVVTLHGFSGAGKTHAAATFALERNYPVIFWIGGESTHTLYDKFLSIGIQAKIVNKGATHSLPSERLELIMKVKDHLEKNPGWLIVFDNVMDSTEVEFNGKGYFPNDGGHILITSQTDNFSTGFENCAAVSVSVMTEDESINLLKKIIKKDTSYEDFKKLATRLHFHPKLLELTARYIQKSPRLTVAGELEKPSPHTITRPDRARGIEDAVRAGFAQRWEEHLKYLDKFQPDVGAFVRTIAYLSPLQIPLKWIPTKVASQLEDLEGWGYITRHQIDDSQTDHPGASHKGFISIHHLVHKALGNVVSDEMSTTSLEAAIQIVLGETELLFMQRFLDPVQNKLWQSHATALLQSIPKDRSSSFEIAQIETYLARIKLEELDAEEVYSYGTSAIKKFKYSANPPKLALCKAYTVLSRLSNIEKHEELAYAHAIMALKYLNDQDDRSSEVERAQATYLAGLNAPTPSERLQLLKEAEKIQRKLVSSDAHKPSPLLIDIALTLRGRALALEDPKEKLDALNEALAHVDVYFKKNAHPKVFELLTECIDAAIIAGEIEEANSMLTRATEMSSSLGPADKDRLDEYKRLLDI